MAAPANITRLLAQTITLPHSSTTNVTFAGTTYETWWKFVPPTDGIVKVWGYGGLDGYMPFLDAYENNSTDLYLNLGEEWIPVNVPVYMPVTSGNTYYLNFYMRDLPLSDVASLVLSVGYVPVGTIQVGDFLTNLEVDTDAERPMCVLAGDESQTVRLYQQMATPAAIRGTDGLPHGESGVVWANGSVAWGDDQYYFIKIYDKNLALVSTISDYVAASSYQSIGFSRAMQRMYVAYDAGATISFDARDSTGALLDTWPTTETIFVRHLGVNADESILYYTLGGFSYIKRWDLINGVALANLVPDTVGYEITDLLILGDDTILACYHQDATAPRDVYVKHYDTAGSTLHTYSFGDFWRQEFNPPRIGFDLDSSTHFWITLKPEGQFDVSLFKKVKISDGSYTFELDHVNYLAGVYLGGLSPTITILKTDTGTQNVGNVAGFTHDVVVSVLVKETFANGSGAQPLMKIGTTSDDDIIAPTSTFTDATAGTNLTFPYSFRAGERMKITFTARTGTGTGSIVVGAFSPDTFGPLGSEKAYPLLLATQGSIEAPPNLNGPAALEYFKANGFMTDHKIVRVRRAPHMADEQQRIFYSKFQLDIEAGVGTVSGQGVDPVLQLRWSNDGGFTWNEWRTLGSGKLGEYRFRCITHQLGSARDRVFEVRQSDPVKSVWLAAYLDIDEGAH